MPIRRLSAAPIIRGAMAQWLSFIFACQFIYELPAVITSPRATRDVILSVEIRNQ